MNTPEFLQSFNKIASPDRMRNNSQNFAYTIKLKKRRYDTTQILPKIDDEKFEKKIPKKHNFTPMQEAAYDTKIISNQKTKFTRPQTVEMSLTGYDKKLKKKRADLFLINPMSCNISNIRNLKTSTRDYFLTKNEKEKTYRTASVKAANSHNGHVDTLMVSKLMRAFIGRKPLKVRLISEKKSINIKNPLDIKTQVKATPEKIRQKEITKIFLLSNLYSENTKLLIQKLQKISSISLPKSIIKIQHKQNEYMNFHPINIIISLINSFSQIFFKSKTRSKTNVGIILEICEILGIQLKKLQMEPNILRDKEFNNQLKNKIIKILFKVLNEENGTLLQNSIKIDEEQINFSQQIKTEPVIHKCYIGKGNNSILIKRALLARGNWRAVSKKEIAECNFIWTEWKKIDYFKKYSKAIYNHLENNNAISNKKDMFHNMRSYYLQKGIDPFIALPITFHVTETYDSEYIKFEQMFETNKKQATNKNIWIVKPGEFTNRGNGILISNSISDIKNYINMGKHKENRSFIIQKYIEHPLLINNRKFDIRCYSLCTSINKKLKAYFYKEGYIRTSSTEFSLKNLNNKFVHLTNDAIQINSKDYGKHEPGNKLSYQEFQRILDAEYANFKVNFERDLLLQIKKLVADSILSVSKILDGQKLTNCIEIFGYDFMIDADFNIKLIEINTNPCLELTSPLLTRIIPNFVDDFIRISIDPIFSPYDSISKKISQSDILQEIKFDLIFDSEKDYFN